ITILYQVVITFMFFVGGAFAVVIRLELATPQADLMEPDTYNKMFTMHGIVMVFFFLIPGIPSILGNFLVPIMIGAKDLAFPKLNLLSWYIYVFGAIFTIWGMLGTPVIAITLVLVAVERVFAWPIFSPPEGDPILFQHLFWFYSHPAVYIMILPAMGVISELVTAFSRKTIFGYHFVAFSSMAIAVFGFLVWGHHMFVAGQSIYAALIFSAISYVVAIPSAIKVFNWTAT